MANAIRSFIYSHIKALIAQSQGLASVPHDLTRGQLREQLLLGFFNAILPDRYTICSGFITDSFGSVSPQIDFIVAETSEIPRLVLNREVSLVPVEAMRAIVEIKSQIEMRVLRSQLERQMAEFNKMRPNYWAAASSPFHVRAYVIGFDARENALQRFMKENNNVRGCCVIGKCSFVRHDVFEHTDVVRLEDDLKNDEYEATATFIACVFRDLETVSLTHSPSYQLAGVLNSMPDPTMKEAARQLLGKRWFWEAYVSETIAKASEKYSMEQQ